MAFADFQGLSREEARQKLLQCCHSRAWAERLVDARSSARNLSEFQAEAEKIWNALEGNDWLEAFAAHPKIGDISSLRTKYANTQKLASVEQSSVAEASQDLLEELAFLNQEYERKNGFIFIVFATGKTAAEMLALLKGRIGNSRDTELKNAAAEQAKIFRLRLEKLL